MSALGSILLAGTPAPWVALGLRTGPDPLTIGVGSVACRFDVDSTFGIGALGIVGLAAALELDGLVFVPAEPGEPTGAEAHRCRASSVDHVVAMTSSLERTCGAVEAGLGAPLRRIRDVAPGVRQGFHRLGEVILEVVETPQIIEPVSQFWGLVIVVDDLDGWAAALDTELVTPPKPAVQPGRRISNVRRPAGLPCAVAFMSPDPRIR